MPRTARGCVLRLHKIGQVGAAAARIGDFFFFSFSFFFFCFLFLLLLLLILSSSKVPHKPISEFAAAVYARHNDSPTKMGH